MRQGFSRARTTGIGPLHGKYEWVGDPLALTGKLEVVVREATSEEERLTPGETVKRFRHRDVPATVTFVVNVSVEALAAMIERAANNKGKKATDGPLTVTVTS